MVDEQLLHKDGDQRQRVDPMVHPDGNDLAEKRGTHHLAVVQVQAPEVDEEELETKDTDQTFPSKRTGWSRASTYHCEREDD